MPPRLQLHALETITIRDTALIELLRARVLLGWLDAIPRTELHLRLFRIADESTKLAVQSGFPLLVLPELFEEKARTTLSRYLVQKVPSSFSHSL